MPMLKIKGITQAEVLQVSKSLIDELARIIGCPRDYFTIELVNNNFIMDGEVVAPPTMIEVYWFDRGQTVQDEAAQCITAHFQKERDCLDVVFYSIEHRCYYENGQHF
ncbi:MAG TPA: DUF1904 domain-containing protein [Firmicutes bacterium]|nr:DUF1904 domain-containing protein [Bacillota bacterium]